MTGAETWIIEEPNAGAPIEVMETWLSLIDIDIDRASSAAHKKALQEARQRVLTNLLRRRGGAMRFRQDLDQPGAVKF